MPCKSLTKFRLHNKVLVFIRLFYFLTFYRSVHKIKSRKILISVVEFLIILLGIKNHLQKKQEKYFFPVEFLKKKKH